MPDNHAGCEAEITDLVMKAFSAGSPKTPTLAGQMRVTEALPEVADHRYPPTAYLCPHGQRFHVWPDADRIAALAALDTTQETP